MKQSKFDEIIQRRKEKRLLEAHNKIKLEYENKLKASLPEQFKRFIDPANSNTFIRSNLEDPEFQYDIPDIIDERLYDKLSIIDLPEKKFTIRLPSRLESPIILFPPEVKELFKLILIEKEDEYINTLNLTTASNVKTMCEELKPFMITKITDDIHTILINLKNAFNITTEYISSDLVGRLTRQFIRFELGALTMNQDFKPMVNIYNHNPSKIVILVLKIRYLITKAIGENFTGKYELYSGKLKLKKLENNTILIYINNICVFFNDRIMAILKKGELMVAPSSILDYFFTAEEVLENITVLSLCPDYGYLEELLIILKELYYNDKHNLSVNFMKNMEPYCIMTADFRSSKLCSVNPYLDVIEEMVKIANELSPESITVKEVLDLSFNDINNTKNNILIKLTKILRRITIIDILELSSLHKSFFYSHIDEDKGMMKYLKRVHTKRPTNINSEHKPIAMFNKIFLLNYYKKHKKLPDIYARHDNSLTEEQKLIAENNYLELYQALTNRKYVEGMFEEHFWLTLRPFDCLNYPVEDETLEFVKDKASCKTIIRNSTCDTEREILHYLKSEKVEFKQIKGGLHPKLIKITNQDIDPYSPEYPVMLRAKEREQKAEGRYFGMNSTPMKQTLSLYMEKAKKVFSYFPGNLMTVSNKDKKMRIHNMAQLLNNPKYFAIMADVEGHNQSMQPHNTGELLKSVGLTYGEKDWSKLADFYSQLTVINPSMYKNNCYVSKGQLGGIEGWYNYTNTLHTYLLLSLIEQETSIKLIDFCLYSDDIVLITELDNPDNETINNRLTEIRLHFAKYGMVLKTSQTMVSKYRLTLLRNHYIFGVKSDSSLKRLASTTCISNSFLHSEAIESQSIISCISSALEQSNTIFPHICIKYMRLIPLLLRNFTTTIDFNIPNSISKLIYENRHELPIHAAPDVENMVNNLKLRLDSTDTTKLQRILKKRDRKEEMALLMTQHDTFDFLFFCKMHFPEQFGGLGILNFDQLCISGNTDNVMRTLSFIEIVAKIDNRKELFRKMVSNLTKSSSEPEIKNILSGPWPFRSSITPSHKLKSIIEKWVKQNCKNKLILKIIKDSESASTIIDKIADNLRMNYHYRVGQFYSENNITFIWDKLIKKFNTTTSTLNKITKLEKGRIARTFIKTSTMNFRYLLNEVVDRKEEWLVKNDLPTFLMKRRNALYPKVKFIDILEVDPSYTVKRTHEDGQFNIYHTTATKIKDGIEIMKQPAFGNEANYKGELSEEDKLFTNIREILAYKLISVTKWIISRSGLKDEAKLKNNIVATCNICLTSLGFKTYSYLKTKIKDLTHSEIMHRIPLLDAKTQAFLRVFPNLQNYFHCHIDIDYFKQNSLMDSNIHFDYFMYKFRLIALIEHLFKPNSPACTSFAIRDNGLIIDVRKNFTSPKEITHENQDGKDLDKLKLIFHPYIEHTDLSEQILESDDDQAVIRHYVTSFLKILQIENIWRHNTIVSDQVWEDFYQFHQSKLEVLNIRNFKEFKKTVKRIAKQLISENRVYKLRDNNYLQTISRAFINKYKLENTKESLIKAHEKCISALLFDIEMPWEFSKIILKYFLVPILVNEYFIVKFSDETHHYEIDENLVYKHVPKLHFRLTLETLTRHLRLPTSAYFDNITRQDIFTAIREVCEEYYEFINQDLEIKDIELENDINPIKRELNYISESYQVILTTPTEIMPNPKKLEQAIKLRANPASFESPTGSDIYTSAYSLLNKLINDDFINNKTKLIDLACGRGDFVLAGKDLGINSIGYTRESIWSKLCTQDEIIILDKYDVFELAENHNLTYTIQNTNDAIIIIDISFSSKDLKNINDLIQNLHNINDSLKLLIRITEKLDTKSLIEKYNDNIMCMHMYEASVISPYMYLYIDFKRILPKYTSTIDYMKEIIPSIKKLPLITNYEKEHSYNSAIDKLQNFRTLNLNELITKLYKTSPDNHATFLHKYNRLIKAWPSTIRDQSETRPREWEFVKKAYKGLPNHIIRHLKHIWPSVISYVDLRQTNIDRLIRLTNNEYSKSLLTRIKRALESGPNDEDSIAKRYVKSKYTNIFGSLRSAVLLTLADDEVNSASERWFINNSLSKPYKMNYYIDTIHFRKLLSPLKNSLQNYVNTLEENTRLDIKRRVSGFLQKQRVRERVAIVVEKVQPKETLEELDPRNFVSVQMDDLLHMDIFKMKERMNIFSNVKGTKNANEAFIEKIINNRDLDITSFMGVAMSKLNFAEEDRQVDITKVEREPGETDEDYEKRKEELYLLYLGEISDYEGGSDEDIF